MKSQSEVITVQDKYYAHQALFYAFGVLFSVNKDFFTTANDYWMYKFRDPTLDFDDGKNRTHLQAQFISTYQISAIIFHVVTMCITIIFLLNTSPIKRLFYGMATILSCFIFTVILALADTDSWQEVFFGMNLIISGLLASACCVCSISIFQLVPKFPPEYLTFTVTGTAISGIFSALTQILALEIGADSRSTGIIYFSIGTTFILLTLFGFTGAVYKSRFFNYYLKIEAKEEFKPTFSKDIMKSLLNKTKYYILALIIIMGPTALVHPGITSLVISLEKGSGNPWNKIYFVPVVTFLSYNILDLIGRELARVIQKPKNDVLIIVGSIIRLSIIPLFLFCNAQPRHHLRVLFGDGIYILLIVLFGFSHGYLVNLIVLFFPQTTTKEEMKVASILIMIVMMMCVIPFSFLSPVLVSTL